jgi:hypothetical protein
MTFVASFVLFLGAYLFFRRRLIRAAYYEGQRAGLKQARDLLAEKGHTSLYLSPEGKLTYGLARAQLAHDMASEVGSLIHQVGR